MSSGNQKNYFWLFLGQHLARKLTIKKKTASKESCKFSTSNFDRAFSFDICHTDTQESGGRKILTMRVSYSREWA
jgi:hypothetical protein